jgi:hypothetical protein
MARRGARRVRLSGQGRVSPVLTCEQIRVLAFDAASEFDNGLITTCKRSRDGGGKQV